MDWLKQHKVALVAGFVVGMFFFQVTDWLQGLV